MVDVRKVKTGDIMMVSSRRTWLARTIIFFQSLRGREAGQYQHSGVFVWVWDKLFVVEALQYGIAMTPFADYERKIRSGSAKVLHREYNGASPIVDSHAISAYIVSYAGNAPYDFVNLVLHQPIRILFGKWIGRKCDKASRRFICHEFTLFIEDELHTDLGLERWCEGNAHEVHALKGFENFILESV